MAFLRHKQRVVTGISPHNANRRFLVPNNNRGLAMTPPQLFTNGDLDPTTVVGTGTAVLQAAETPMPAAMTANNIAEALSVEIPTSSTATPNAIEVHIDIADSQPATEDLWSIGMVWWRPFNNIYRNTAGRSDTWGLMAGSSFNLWAYQVVGDNDYRVTFDPGANIFVSKEGWNTVRFHHDTIQTTGANVDFSQPFVRVVLLFTGYNNVSDGGGQPAFDARFDIGAVTFNGYSEPVVLVNYDHANDSLTLGSGAGTHELHKAKGVPYSVGVNIGYWNPDADTPGDPDAPTRANTMTLAETNALTTDWSGACVTHHLGSGEASVTNASVADGGLNHPNTHDFTRQGAGIVREDLDATLAYCEANLAKRSANVFKTMSWPVGDINATAENEVAEGGMKLCRATRFNPSANRTASEVNPWILNYPDFFVDALRTNTMNTEDNTADEDRLLQNTTAIIDAAVLHGGTVDTFIHAQYPSTEVHDISGIAANTITTATPHNMVNGDKVLIGGITDTITTQYGQPRGSATLLNLSCAHWTVRNATATTFTLENRREDTTAVTITGTYTSGGWAALATPNSDGTTLEMIEELLDHINASGIRAMRYDEYAQAAGLT